MNNYITNLPTFYAPMPIYEEDKIVAYIVMKCYLVGEYKVYLTSGDAISTYDIVYCYNQYKERQIPIFENNKYTNSVTTTNIYKNFKECKNIVRLRNASLLNFNYHDLSMEETIYLYNHKDDFFKDYYDLETELYYDRKIVKFRKVR